MFRAGGSQLLTDLMIQVDLQLDQVDTNCGRIVVNEPLNQSHIFRYGHMGFDTWQVVRIGII